MKIYNFISYILWAFLSTLIYVILREDFSLETIIIGFLIGISALIVCILLFDKSYIIGNNLKKVQLIWYAINLIIVIIISGFKSLFLSIFHDSTAEQLTYNSYLENDILITLLANSITLTPGTVTVDKQDNVLKIMKLCKKNCEVDTNDIKHLEKMIAKIQRVERG